MLGRIRCRLAFDRVAGSARTVSSWAAALRYETRDNTVERQSVIVTGVGQLLEVRNRARRFFRQKLNFHLSAIFQYDFTFFHIGHFLNYILFKKHYYSVL
ncbi:hypothetical protein D3C77_665110 [compost metagenome]